MSQQPWIVSMTQIQASLAESKDDSESTSSSGSLQAAIARTASRSLALYFARPVRLFRPAKVNGWQILKNLAKQQGEALSPQYLLSLVKLNGVGVIPKHFIPPMIVNATLGFVLWESYGIASSGLEPYLSSRSLANAAMSGATAGACQAVVAAPAENVRLLLEGGFGGCSWSSAWKQVFREKSPSTAVPKSRQIHDIRVLRTWVQEISQMAGRGWEGWGWGCAKDAAGFAAFFCIFEVSRRAGMKGRSLLEETLSRSHCIQENSRVRQLPAIVNGITLVSGGVFAGLAYELTCRPFDIARRAIYLDRIEMPEPSYRIIQRRFMKDGIKFFFQANIMPGHGQPVEQLTKGTGVLRTIGRVGPWGIGFLVWEAYGPSEYL